MTRGEPGLPRRFSWRDRGYEVSAVEASWKSHGEDRGDVYVRRHWYDIRTTCGQRMRIYFDRNPGRAGSRRSRWWVYSLEGEPDFFTTQTLVQLVMQANGALPFDEDKYVLQLDDQFAYADFYASSRVALRHYVRPVRHKFWIAAGSQ